MTNEQKPENQNLTQKLQCSDCSFKGTPVCIEVQKTPVCEKYKGNELADEIRNTDTFKCSDISYQRQSTENKVRQYLKCDECPFEGREEICKEASQLHEWCQKYQKLQEPTA